MVWDKTYKGTPITKLKHTWKIYCSIFVPLTPEHGLRMINWGTWYIDSNLVYQYGYKWYLGAQPSERIRPALAATYHSISRDKGYLGSSDNLENFEVAAMCLTLRESSRSLTNAP
jgi:hypothetical protein